MTQETTLDSAPEAVAEQLSPAHKSLVINVLLVSTFVVMLNETAMVVAIPSLMTALGVDANAAQWLTAAFLTRPHLLAADGRLRHNPRRRSWSGPAR